MRGQRSESGQTTLLIIGFATMLVMLVGVVVDASSAYLQRQGLDNLADGAALHAADHGAAAAYESGLGEEYLEQQADGIRKAVVDYLVRADALRRYPGIEPRITVDVARSTVTVTLRAPLDLPFPVPGETGTQVVSSAATAAVVVAR